MNEDGGEKGKKEEYKRVQNKNRQQQSYWTNEAVCVARDESLDAIV